MRVNTLRTLDGLAAMSAQQDHQDKIHQARIFVASELSRMAIHMPTYFVRSFVIALALILRVNPVRAQTATETSLRAVVEDLFLGMRRSDTAIVRRAFVANAIVTPVSATAGGASLDVDAFVRFAGRNAAESWIERMWNAHGEADGPLGVLWFEYDVVRNGVVTQCGVNSVQLRQTPTGWRILSMAFTARQTGCPARG